MPILHNGPIDALLNAIRGGTTLRVLAGESGSLEEARELTLGTAIVSAVDYGPITSYGAGRSMSGPTAQASIAGGGTATHISLDNGSELLHVSELAEPQLVKAGGARTVSYGTIRVPRQGTAA